ncbi:MAG: phosphoserine phosphatase [Thermoplasmata archaeon]|nr:phosphoserine phosphatase [Thermoplasmata archaeon]
MPDEVLYDLEKKIQELNAEAERYRQLRDNLNAEAKRWVEERDRLNNEAKKLADAANEHKNKREEYNIKVKEEKLEREKWNKKTFEIADKIRMAKRKKMPKNGDPIAKLKKELKELEFKQMTSVLSREKEEELIKSIARLQAEIRKREKEIEEDEEIKALTKEYEQAKEAAERHHKLVNEYAEIAQREHEKMVELFSRADDLRRQADEAQEKFVKAKLEADEAHRKHVDKIREIHDIEKMVHALKQKTKKEAKTDADKQAEEIYQKLMSGKKITTEELIILQRAGKA